MKLFITDLDDTLYSWIGFFIPAFYAMAEELSGLLGVDRQTLLEEYREIHREKGGVEYPYATLHLPSVRRAYPGRTEKELLSALDPAFHRFNSVRKSRLQLHPQVKETLTAVREMGLSIVGYTESAEENGFYRLRKLGIDGLFRQVYVSDSQFKRPDHLASSPKTRIVQGKKPNPELLRQICQWESVETGEAIYVGDSLTKDIYMAKKAGVVSVLCKYPSGEDAGELYEKLVAISHWTEEDFRRESEIRRLCREEEIGPDYTIDSFQSLLGIIRGLRGAEK